MKKYIVVLMLFFVIFSITGCDDIIPPPYTEPDIPIGAVKKFWAQSMVTDTFYQLDAEKLAGNSRCVVWAEKGSGVTTEIANNFANEYSNNIYDKMINNFGWNKTVASKNMNTMDYAHYLVTGKTSGAKLTILLLDIKDGYKQGVNDSYVAGYFYLYDIFSTNLPSGVKSNVLDMIYIDTSPGLNGSEGIKEAYTTLAHEMQHLMNFVSSIEYRVKDRYIYPMDTWIDEGLSSAAEWLYSGEHVSGRVGWFNLNGNGKGKIDVGNNFYVWGNRVTSSDPYPSLDDYATVYLFFQWIRLQSNNDIYKEIIKSTEYDNKAVISAFNSKKISGSDYSEWGDMLKDWLTANNNNSATGRYGYMNDATLKNIKVSYAPTTSTTISLYPGEGVYSYSTTSPSVDPSGNIKYEYFSGKSTLLTYNANPVNAVKGNENINSLIETGTTTGSKPPAASVIISGNFNIKLASPEISGPFPIGINDVIRANNANKPLNFDISTLERVIADE